MTIEVTQDDIDKGERAECSSCPVARAVSRAVGSRVIVNYVFIFARGLVVELPQSAKAFISRFDAHLPVEPFSFIVNLSRAP